MDNKLMNGRAYADELNAVLLEKVAHLKDRKGIVPALCVMRVGADPAAVSYAKAIEKNILKHNMRIVYKLLPETSAYGAVRQCVNEINADSTIHGAIIQEPLPAGLDKEAIFGSLEPLKDVEGINPCNAGLLARAKAGFDILDDRSMLVPPTPAGGLLLLKKYLPRLDGLLAVVVGRSNILGKPLGSLLLQENATVMYCHSRSKNLPELCRQADVLCAAIGKAHMITAEYVGEGATVLDFGINYAGGKLCGDVDTDAVLPRVKWITPVPGGTGPMTNTVLLYNLYKLAVRHTA